MSEQAPLSFLEEARDNLDDAQKRFQEAERYDHQMEEMAGRPTYRTNSVEDFRTFHSHVADAPSPAYEAEMDAAMAENEAFDADKKSLDSKIASDPKLRQMDMIAHNIATLRKTLMDTPVASDNENANRQVQRLEDLEDRLGELLVSYEKSNTYNENIAKMLIDKTIDEVETPEVPIAYNDSMVQTAEDIVRFAQKKPEVIKTPKFQSALQQVITDIDKAVQVPPAETPVKTENKEDESVASSPTETTATTSADIASESGADSGHGKAEVIRDSDSWMTKVRREVRRVFGSDRQDQPSDFGERKKSRSLGMAIAAVALTATALVGGVSSSESDALHSGRGSGLEGVGTGASQSGHADAISSPSGDKEDTHNTVNRISPGEGWFQLFTDMGIPESDHHALLEKIRISKDPAIQSWRYEMSDGDMGIARPGEIPQSVLESIKNLR
jgi:hypothetical protein